MRSGNSTQALDVTRAWVFAAVRTGAWLRVKNIKASLRGFISTLLLALLFLGCAKGDKPYPSQAITLICPWGAGGGTDRLSRFMADQLQLKLGQPAVVVNKTGGSGAVGFGAGANAPKDGYTITMATFELSTMHWLGISKLTHQNFTPLVQLNADAAAIILPKNSPFKTMDDLLRHIRENPGQLTMSGTAKGAAWDLARSGFLMAAGLPVDSVVWAPSKGAAGAIVDLLGGHIDVVCCSVPEALSQIESGELRALAVMSPKRLADFPNVPTCKELGVPWEAVGWRGLALPRDTPPGIVATLEKACMEIAESDAFKTFMQKNGFAPMIRSPREFGEFLRAQDEQWHKVILGSNVGAASISGDAAASHDPGPWAIPTGLGIFIAGGIAYQALRRKRETAMPVQGSNRLFAGAIVVFAVYLAAMPWIGFFATTSALSIVTIRWLGRGWVNAVISTLVLMAAVYLLFVRVFRVPLPAGIFF